MVERHGSDRDSAPGVSLRGQSRTAGEWRFGADDDRVQRTSNLHVYGPQILTRTATE